MTVANAQAQATHTVGTDIKQVCRGSGVGLRCMSNGSRSCSFFLLINIMQHHRQESKAAVDGKRCITNLALLGGLGDRARQP